VIGPVRGHGRDGHGGGAEVCCRAYRGNCRCHCRRRCCSVRDCHGGRRRGVCNLECLSLKLCGDCDGDGGDYHQSHWNTTVSANGYVTQSDCASETWSEIESARDRAVGACHGHGARICESVSDSNGHRPRCVCYRDGHHGGCAWAKENAKSFGSWASANVKRNVNASGGVCCGVGCRAEM